MLNKLYTCEICKTKPDQLSHHKIHLETQKHKDKKELFELKLSKLGSEELQKIYNTSDVSIIIDENETNTYMKKLINNNFNNSQTNNKEMTDIQKVEQSNNISNKEALKDKIHEIHNYLRNNGAGYGMNALKVFNILYGLKKIEENNLLDKVDLKRPECEFSYLLKLANENKDEKLCNLIYTDILDSINASPIKNLLFYEIPKLIKSSVFTHLIKEINKITVIEKTCNVLLSGKIYEYFIGRDESAISELGAYFTDRHIVDYIYTKLDPKVNKDGSINSMIDMFGGSGGFTTGYINYLNKYKINWNDNINKIYHYDMNEDVIKSAGLEFFCLTGVLPNMNNLEYKNSFTDDFEDKKFMNVITNPPYGGDKIVQSNAQIKREKVKEYIKKELETLTDDLTIKTRKRQLVNIEKQEKQEKKDSDKTKVSVNTCSQRIIKFAKANNLDGKDKESCSLMLIMDMVDVNGTAIGVLKEGVFFNKKYKDIRKCLIEKFNVREIISVPQDQFENTSTKTSIVIFDNTTEKTSNVRFSDLVVERYTEDIFEEINNEIVITQNKGDISGISDKLISEATKDDILKNNICSLNGKDYNKKVIICGKDYELVKLGDIVKFNKYKSQKPSNGKFNYYTCSNTIKKCSDGNINGENILIGTRGTIIEAIHYYNGEFGCGDNMLIFNSNTINNKYIYNILLSTKEQIKNYINGSTIPMISLSQFKNLQIPIPKSKEKITEWINKISKPYDKKNNTEKKLQELEEQVRNQIKDISENEDCNEVELGSVCYLKDGYDFYRNEMDDRKIYINGENLPLLKIGSDEITDYIKINKKYDNVIVNKNDIIIGTKGTCGKIRKVIVDKGYHKHGLLKFSNFTINKEYIYYYLLHILNDELIDKMSNKSVLSNMKKENLIKLKIKLPKNKKLIQDLEPLFLEIETLQQEMKDAENQYNQLIKELGEEAIPTNKTDTTELIENEEIENELLEDEIINTDKKIKKNNIEIIETKTVKTKKSKSKVLTV